MPDPLPFDQRFLLRDGVARDVFAAIAGLPIIDYHSHLDPAQLAADQPVANLTRLWLVDGHYGDHYKWRLMRANGVPEDLITGDADDYAKFEAFCATLARAIGNPVYEWSHLELRRYFDCDAAISAATAPQIWERANALLATPEFRPRAIVGRSNVEVVVTTDDPLDDLSAHSALATAPFRVVPAFRPDRFLAIGDPGFPAYVERAAAVTGRGLDSFAALVEAIGQRMEFFHARGGRLSDHALDTFHHTPAPPADVDAVLRRRLSGVTLSAAEVGVFQTALLRELIGLNRDLGWTAQLHLGAARGQNLPGTAALGRDTGYDSIGTQPDLADNLRRFLQDVHAAGRLSPLVVYPLNPADWPVIATLLGNFQSGRRLQLGAAWWFNDHWAGI
ncbi:MAG: glucuronate isomerase, partial [Propionibacteriaceae bacterium]|nr:glucuronate isomerase [Propionibacteriaceae bacterium]